jgi:hypothetical protein
MTTPPGQKVSFESYRTYYVSSLQELVSVIFSFANNSGRRRLPRELYIVEIPVNSTCLVYNVKFIMWKNEINLIIKATARTVHILLEALTRLYYLYTDGIRSHDPYLCRQRRWPLDHAAAMAKKWVLLVSENCRKGCLEFDPSHPSVFVKDSTGRLGNHMFTYTSLMALKVCHRRGAVDIASASGTEETGSNPARV